MNCDFAKRKVNDIIFSNIEHVEEELNQHLNICQDCNAYYENCKSERKIISFLKQSEPILEDPHKLTDDILDSLDGFESEKQNLRFKFFNTAKRVLVAASVCLIIVFGYENYVVVEKLIRLEEQMTTASGNAANTSLNHNIQYYYPLLKSRFLQSDLFSEALKVDNNDLRFLFIKAKLSSKSNPTFSKQLQCELSQYILSSNSTDLINTIIRGRKISRTNFKITTNN